MKAIILEDEPLVAKDLQKLVSQVDPNIQVIAVIGSVKACIEYFKSNPQPELMFMDIQLSDGVSFDIFPEVSITCPIIFTTAYNEYAIRAFKVNSVDYLLKPVDRNDLAAALAKLRQTRLPATDMKEQLDTLMAHISHSHDKKLYKERFTAHSGKSFIMIQQAYIACFQKSTLIYITTNDQQQFVTDFQTMEEIEEVLNPAIFFRANRQFIIHIDAIESYKADSYGKLLVKLRAPVNTVVDVSREKAQAFRNWLG